VIKMAPDSPLGQPPVQAMWSVKRARQCNFSQGFRVKVCLNASQLGECRGSPVPA